MCAIYSLERCCWPLGEVVIEAKFIRVYRLGDIEIWFRSAASTRVFSCVDNNKEYL